MKYRMTQKLKQKQEDFANRESPVAVCLGDSVTQGCFELYSPHPQAIDTVFRPGEAYPALLKAELDMLYPRAGTVVVNAGISGGKASGGLARLERDVLRFSPDLVTVCFGLNDCGDGPEGIGAYTQALREIFRKVKATGADVFFLTPNMMNTYVSGKLTDPLQRQIAERTAKTETEGILARYLDGARTVAGEEGVFVVDVYAYWRRLYDGGVDVTELLSNLINHPTPPMHRYFANAILKELFHD